MKTNILIAGVGGQGTVLASRLLAASAIEAGFFTRTSETIGMAQRGGSVVSHVRMDSKNSSPIIPIGQGDLLIGFELAETARSLNRLSKSGRCIVNTQVIKPVTASFKGTSYDVEAIRNYIILTVPQAIFVDGYALAEKAGSVKAVNVVLLGVALSLGILPFTKDTVEKVIEAIVPKKFLDLNKKAFNIGFEYSKYTC